MRISNIYIFYLYLHTIFLYRYILLKLSKTVSSRKNSPPLLVSKQASKQPETTTQTRQHRYVELIPGIYHKLASREDHSNPSLRGNEDRHIGCVEQHADRSEESRVPGFQATLRSFTHTHTRIRVYVVSVPAGTTAPRGDASVRNR